MATDRGSGRTRRQVLFVDLYDELAMHRRGEHPRRLATALVRREQAGPQLVGLTDGYERAVFYASASRTLAAYRFDAHGVRESGETLWRDLSDPASWVDAHADRLDWLHPRIRWVLEGDRDCWRDAQ